MHHQQVLQIVGASLRKRSFTSSAIQQIMADATEEICDELDRTEYHRLVQRQNRRRTALHKSMERESIFPLDSLANEYVR